MDIKYNFNKEVSYTSNQEYRQSMRELFYMNTIEITDDIDDETKDEMDYDMDTISPVMDILFKYTKENPRFGELYELAAALMFSIDPDIGQSVLFSYDNLPLFHSCLASFHREPLGFNEQNPCFLALKQKLSR